MIPFTYTLLLKINFNNKDDLDINVLKSIFNDIKDVSSKKKLFGVSKEKNKVFMNYNVEPKQS